MKQKFMTYVLSLVLIVTTMGCVLQNERKEVSAATMFKVHYIDVGTGDAALLQYGSGSSAKYALIDAGPLETKTKSGMKDVRRRAYNYLKKCGVKRLEFVILTHPHIDHIGGMVAILEDESITIGKVYQPTQPRYNHYSGEDDLFETKTYKRINRIFEKKGIPVEQPKVKSSIYLGKAKLTFYAPTKSKYKYGREVNFDVRQINKYSIVCRIVYGKNSFLMTGDTQEEEELSMISKKLYLRSQVLKVPHHGYQDLRVKDLKKGVSNHKKLFDAVKPVVSIVSNGANNYDNIPQPYVKKELSASNIYMTSKNGNIIVGSNGKKLYISTSKNGSNPAITGTNSGRNSRLIRKIKVKSTGKKKISLISLKSKGTYTIKETKSIKLKVYGSAQSYTKLKNVQYKVVKKGKSSSKYRWKNGRTIKLKKGFKGHVYVRYNTTSGSTVMKTKGITIKKK